MNEDMIALSKSYSKKIKLLCQDIVYEMCNSRIRKCIEALLPEDTLQQVKDTCVNVAVKMAMERVKKWVSTHIVEGELFVKEMNGEINKITKSTEMKNDECLQHDPDATSPTSALSLLRVSFYFIYRFNNVIKAGDDDDTFKYIYLRIIY